MSRHVDRVGEHLNPAWQHPILPSQFFEELQHRELGPEESLGLAILSQACADWIDLTHRGRVSNSHHGEEVTREDAHALRAYLFDDNYGKLDDNFLPISTICKAVVIDIHALRARLLAACSLGDFERVIAGLPTERELGDRRDQKIISARRHRAKVAA